ncbi:MAG: hypothetical protein AB3N64_07290 [Puniceicoccaceae bacterium]
MNDLCLLYRVFNAIRLPLLFLAFMGASLQAQEFRTYVGESGAVWESPTNWNPNLVPDSITEGARIEGALVNVGSDIVISALEALGSARIVINQDNSLTTSTMILGGTLDGTGTVRIVESGIIGGGQGNGFEQLTVINDGTLTINQLFMKNSARFENKNTILLFDGSSIDDNDLLFPPVPPSVINTGFIRKEAGTGTATFSAPFDNQLEVFCGEGLLRVAGGGVNSGQFRTETPGIIRLMSREIVFEDGSTIIGDGETRLAAKMSVPDGVTVPVNNFTLASSGFIGGEGTVKLSGNSLEFESGKLGDAVLVQVTNGAELAVKGGTQTNLEGTSELHINTGGTIVFDEAGSALVNNGTATLRVDGSLEFSDDGDINNNGPINNFSYLTIINNGSITKTGGTGESLLVARDYSGGGTLRVETGTLRAPYSGLTLSGTIEVLEGTTLRGGSSLIFGDSSTLRGGGTIRATTVVFSGPTQPGQSIGTLAVTGKAELSSTATLEIELGAGNASDRLSTSGTLSLDGTLVVSLENGFNPVPGNVWTILSGSAVSGTFSEVSLPVPAEGFEYVLAYGDVAVVVAYERTENFRKALEGATGESILPGSDLIPFAGQDADGDRLPNLLEWAIGTDLASPDADPGFEIVDFSVDGPVTFTFRYPYNEAALEAGIGIQGAATPEGPYAGKSPSSSQTETVDGITYRVEELVLAGEDDSRYFRLTVELE